MYASDLRHPLPLLEDKLHQLYNLDRHKKIDLSFRPPYLELLEAFGNPHLHLPPIVHVAGTNGKGSIIAFLRSVLEEAGYKVHAYTSPHLMRFNERICLAGAEIEDEPLEALIDEALELNKGRETTFFEITTAMAFSAFSQMPADVVLLETGLGGRLDCTNVIEEPLVTIINEISYDHTEHLGESLKEIAEEKAGIMKPHAPCIIGVQNNEALEADVMEVFEHKAHEKNVMLYRYGADWSIETRGNLMCFRFGSDERTLPMPSLPGIHQVHNTGAVLAALEVIKDKFNINIAEQEQGLRDIQWKGRLQSLTPGFGQIPALPPGWEIWLDGGHNKSAGETLADQCKTWEQEGKDVHIVLSMMAHKSPADFLTPLAQHLKSLTYTELQNEPHALSTQKALPKIKKFKEIKELLTAETIPQAIKLIAKNNKEPGVIMIAGSLYMAGHVLKLANDL